MQRTLPEIVRNCNDTLLDCLAGLDVAMVAQMEFDCQCHSVYWRVLHGEIRDCKSTFISLKDNSEDSPLWLPLLDCMEHILTKAQDCIIKCRPTRCTRFCAESCHLIHMLTRDCLEVAKPDEPSRVKWEMLLDLLREVRDNPQVVMCGCQTHYNSFTVSAYLQMASLVVSSLILPLIPVGGNPSPHTDNCLLEEGSIHLAALKRSVPLAEQAIENGYNVNRLDSSGNTALHIAIILGDLHMVQLLLDSKAYHSIPNKDDITPLLLATIAQQRSLVEVVCSKGADPCKINDKGFSPIMIALSLEDKEMVEILLNYNNTFVRKNERHPVVVNLGLIA